MAFEKENICECSSMVEFQPSKLVAWVRFPSLAPICALSSVDRVPGYEPVGRRFESSWARHKKQHTFWCAVFYRVFGCKDLTYAVSEGSHFKQRRLGACSQAAKRIIFAKRISSQHLLVCCFLSCFWL